MKLKVLIMSIFVTVAGLSAGDLSVQSSYIVPMDDENINSSLTLGLGYDFWGVFEFSALGYLEIAAHGDNFFDRLATPELFSAGVGMNIPMGGFYLIGDYHRFFAVRGNISALSISQYTDSYSIGVGIPLNSFLQVDIYHRVLLEDNLFNFDGTEKGFIGVGVKLYL